MGELSDQVFSGNFPEVPDAEVRRRYGPFVAAWEGLHGLDRRNALTAVAVAVAEIPLAELADHPRRLCIVCETYRLLYEAAWRHEERPAGQARVLLACLTEERGEAVARAARDCLAGRTRGFGAVDLAAPRYAAVREASLLSAPA